MSLSICGNHFYGWLKDDSMDDGWFIASPKPPPYEMPQARQTKDYLYNSKLA
jgi:hypothetical protein